MAKPSEVLSSSWNCAELLFCPHREKEQQVKDLAIWHWFLWLGSRIPFMLRGGCPQSAQKRGRLSSPERSAQSLSFHHLSVSTLHESPNIVSHSFLKCWILKTVQSLHAYTQNPKLEVRESNYLLVCVCIWRDLKEGERILKNSSLLPNLLFLLLKNSRENNNNKANTH